ncbi:hypothetical protein H6G89_26600 [Oscillatoria sp. FACHB-1407]|uniref:hypothetical protein n=1 Tax=Oscillatoria sp. FACHB-1407 TaxID=2692847 RepID=UPI00168698A2|nr:hypothetical protein [Oscillatoria sp. FACHB-1407]MBD2464582.1 hypothetical protein [Oscillatoria sp. FACHB-1407]
MVPHRASRGTVAKRASRELWSSARALPQWGGQGVWGVYHFAVIAIAPYYVCPPFPASIIPS